MAKTAISLTVAELNTHIANSTLVKDQWYLITDYKTVDYIRNSDKTDGNNGIYEFHE